MGVWNQSRAAGQDGPVTGAVTVPVYQTSTYQQDAVGKIEDTNTQVQ